MVQKSLQSAINTTVVSYGQTGAGKTFTLLGVKEAPGFIPCVFRDLFILGGQQDYRYTFRISYTEIYNENLIDLLSPANKNLKIMNGTDWGCEVSAITKETVKTFQ